MNLEKLIKSKRFKDKNQFEKREIVEKYILNKDSFSIGSNVICFEEESIVDKKNQFFYQKGKNKIKNLTLGKRYKVIEIKEDNIKVENDNGSKLWYSMKRFVYSIKIERKEKLNKIINNE